MAVFKAAKSQHMFGKLDPDMFGELRCQHESGKC